MRLFYFLIVIVIFSCSNHKNQSPYDFLKEGSKEKIKSKKKEYYFNEKDAVYTNFKHNVAFKEMYGWETDFGIGKYSIFRSFQKDSAYTFAIIVTELKEDLIPKDKKFNNIHSLYNYINYDSLIIKSLSQRVKLNNFKSNKIFLKNEPAVKYSYKTLIKQFDFEYEEITITVQVNKNNKTYSFSTSAPLLLYNTNPSRFDTIFNWIHFLN